MPGSWSYDPTALATTPKYQVRRLIGDVLSSDQQIYDEEINFFLSTNTNIYRAAADCCRSISSQYARKVDVVEQDRRIAYSTQARSYQMRADELDRLANLKGAGMPYAGGISVMDKLSQVLNGDRVTPQYNLGMTDSYSPVAPAGNVVPDRNPEGESTI